MPIRQFEWRETDVGWTINLGDGVSANILETRDGAFRWNLMLTGKRESFDEALEEVTAKLTKLGFEALVDS